MIKHILISIVIIILPFTFFLLGKSSSEAVSNVGQLAEMLYLSPGLIVKDELFEFQKDIGLLPTNLGRFLVVMFYLLVYWGAVFLIRKKARS